jgi:hypothetical protein
MTGRARDLSVPGPLAVRQATVAERAVRRLTMRLEATFAQARKGRRVQGAGGLSRSSAAWFFEAKSPAYRHAREAGRDLERSPSATVKPTTATTAQETL